jgi:cytochrome d ubiquinol oxidase subunit II
MFTMDLNLLWYLLVGILLTGYAILDGFDLGVGTLHLFTRSDEHRRLMLNAIGPVWDGNEVWLVTGGGALFAAFPEVYATTMSAFYLAVMLLLVFLILRAVSIEFRSKVNHPLWRGVWDTLFAIGSTGSALILGVALGNVIQGLPLNADLAYTGGLFPLLNPYALLVGITTVALFSMHAALYVVMKVDGDLREKASGWIPHTTAIFLVCYVALTMSTLIFMPHMAQKFRDFPVLIGLSALHLLVIANIPRLVYGGRFTQAFVFSCLNIILLMALVGLGLFPNLLEDLTRDPYTPLTLYSAASSQKTLGILTIIAAIGVPLVLAYTVCVYWIFRGKVRLESNSY